MDVKGTIHGTSLLASNPSSTGHSKVTIRANSSASGGYNRPYLDLLSAAGTGMKLSLLGDNSNRLTFGSSDGNAADPVAIFMTLNESGNLGIGTTAPATTLQVGTASPTSLRSGTVAIFGNGGSTTAVNGIQIPTGSAGATGFIDFGLHGGSSGLGSIQYNTASNYFAFLTNFSERLRIDTSGNVGIGTTSPSGLFDVSRSRSLTPSSTVGAYLAFAASTLTDTTTAASGTATGATFNSIAAPTLAATNTSVTTTNANTLYLGSGPIAGTNETITNSSALYIAAGNVGTSTTNGYGLYVNAPTGSTNKYAAVFSGGNVGIGTTSPASMLEVQSSGGNPKLRVSVSESPSSYRGDLAVAYADVDTLTLQVSGQKILSASRSPSKTSLYTFNSGGTPDERLTVLGSNVGIGTTVPGYKLEVVGSINASGGNVYASGVQLSSDRRLKTEIEPLDQSLEKILSLDGVNFYWKDKSVDSGKQIGFIAQEIQKTFPEVVKERKDGYLTVNYAALVSPVVESIKEFYSRWESDSSAKAREIERLRQENSAIKSYLCGKDPAAPFCR